MRQQITTFKHAWPMLAEGGVWLTEDTATSYDGSLLADGRPLSVAEFGGGYGKNDTWCLIGSDPVLPCCLQRQLVRSARCLPLCACRRSLQALAMLTLIERWFPPERRSSCDLIREPGD